MHTDTKTVKETKDNWTGYKILLDTEFDVRPDIWPNIVPDTGVINTVWHNTKSASIRFFIRDLKDGIETQSAYRHQE